MKTSECLALLLIALMATSSLVLLTVNPINAQPAYSTTDFSYDLNGTTIPYSIANNSAGYSIVIYVMEPHPLQISFTDQFPNGTETRVTKPIAYGMTIQSAGYPTDVSFAIVNQSAAQTTQTVTKPSVPEFSLRYIGNSYYVPTVTAIDPYTGNTVITQEGYQASNNTIEIKIKNQPYSGSINGSEAWIVFNVQQKGHYGNDTGRTLYWFNEYDAGTLPSQSTSDYTIIIVPANDLPAGGSVDFQVQAIAEYKTTIICYPHIGTDLGAYAATGYAIAEYSDWSDPQTIRIIDETAKDSTPTPTLIATQSSNNSGVNWDSAADFITLPIGTFVVVVAVVVILAVAVVLLLLRRHTGSDKVNVKYI